MLKLSISPAELFVANLVLRMVHRVAYDKLRGSSRFVARCDNSSACFAINHRRVKSVPMHTGVLLVLESERVTGLKMRLEYFSTALNSVPVFSLVAKLKKRRLWWLDSGDPLSNINLILGLWKAWSEFCVLLVFLLST